VRKFSATFAAVVFLSVVAAGPAFADKAVDTHGVVTPDRTALDILSERIAAAGQARDSAVSNGQDLREQSYGRICKGDLGGLASPLNGSCAEADAFTLEMDCGGDTPLLPLFERVRVSEAEPWSAWVPLNIGGCPADLLPVLTEADFRRLPLAPPALHLQPDRGWALVNKELIVTTERTEQTLRTELLGRGIDVVATPDTFTYDFGDGSSDLVTRSAGHPYPDHDTFHVYTGLGTVQVTLTTTWQGRYRVDGTTQWREVVGTAQTSATSAPFTVEERRSRLVAGLCTDTPKPADCG
jgi:hypothetical protein